MYHGERRHGRRMMGIFKCLSGDHHVQEEASCMAIRQDQMVNMRKSFLTIIST